MVGSSLICNGDDDPQASLTINGGTFNQPNFLLRFLTGDTKYSMAGYPTTLFNNVYRRDNRSIRQQVLALTAVEKAALQDYVQWFAREENKYYRYDYYSELSQGNRVRLEPLPPDA